MNKATFTDALVHARASPAALDCASWSLKLKYLFNHVQMRSDLMRLIASNTRQHLAICQYAKTNTCAVLRLLQASKRHLCARNVLFRILQVLEQRLHSPDDSFSLVCVSVLIVSDRASLPPKKPIQIRPQFVRPALTDDQNACILFPQCGIAHTGS